MENKVCSVEGCGRDAKSRGFCRTHYAQILRNGCIISKGTSRRTKNEIRTVGEDVFVSLYDKRGNQICEFVTDSDSYEKIKMYKWSLNSHGYVKSGKNTILHRIIAGCTDGKIHIDHIDRDRLNNRSSNLRFATISENQRNTALTKRNSSGFKGVSRFEDIWQAAIRVNNEQIYLGHFKTKETAALAYDKAVKKYHGEEFGVTNASLGLL